MELKFMVKYFGPDLAEPSAGVAADAAGGARVGAAGAALPREERALELVDGTAHARAETAAAARAAWPALLRTLAGLRGEEPAKKP